MSIFETTVETENKDLVTVDSRDGMVEICSSYGGWILSFETELLLEDEHDEETFSLKKVHNGTVITVSNTDEYDGDILVIPTDGVTELINGRY